MGLIAGARSGGLRDGRYETCLQYAQAWVDRDPEHRAEGIEIFRALVDWIVEPAE